MNTCGPDHRCVSAEAEGTQEPGRTQSDGGLGRGKSSEGMNGNQEDAHSLFSHLGTQGRSEKKYTTEKSPEQKDKKQMHHCFNHSSGNPARGRRSLPGAEIVPLRRFATREDEDSASPPCHGLCGCRSIVLRLVQLRQRAWA